MKRMVSVLSAVVLCLSVATVAAASIVQTPATGPTNISGYGGGCYNSGYWGNYYYGLYPIEYCVQCTPQQWVPVQVMTGRLEYRPVWIPGYPLTLYRFIPGRCQRITPETKPGVSGQQQPSGYFDPMGSWYPYPPSSVAP